MQKRVNRSAGRRPGSYRPDRDWAALNAGWSFAAVAETSVSPLVELQAPLNLGAPLTADPPEDLTVLRVVGDFRVTMSVVNSSWTLALLVQDVTWTPVAFNLDSDKRILWNRPFSTFWSTGGAVWTEGDVVFDTADPSRMPHLATGWTHIDIQPKVRVSPGKALYLVAYENIGASTFTTSAANMRVLYQRSGRR